MKTAATSSQLLEWRDGVAYFHGVRVDHRIAHVAGRGIKLAVLKDAAELLDQPHLEKLFVETDRLPYGLELWPASQILAELVLTNPPLGQARDRRVGQSEEKPEGMWDRFSPGHGSNLGTKDRIQTGPAICGQAGPANHAIEIGCGLGLVGIAATLAGWHVRATDIDPMALDFARMNAELNGVTVAEWGELDWRNPPTDRRYDRVFGADILYELVHHAPILSCVKQLLAPNGVALISDPHRGVADRIADMAREEGFDVRIMSGEAPNHLGQTIRGRVFELRIPDKSAT